MQNLIGRISILNRFLAKPCCNFMRTRHSKSLFPTESRFHKPVVGIQISTSLYSKIHTRLIRETTINVETYDKYTEKQRPLFDEAVEWHNDWTTMLCPFTVGHNRRGVPNRTIRAFVCYLAYPITGQCLQWLVFPVSSFRIAKIV